MRVLSVPITPFPDQRPGTSGLRKKVAVFGQPGYVEAFVQALFDALPEAVGDGVAGKTLVLGGDGRFFNDTAAQIILRLMAGYGVARVLVGCGGLLSTPAASAVIRGHGAFGGIVLSASHNPGGRDGDFGIKYNLLAARGEPATAILADHWRRYGRHFYARHDYEGLPIELAGRLIERLCASLPILSGRRFAGFTVAAADDFAYVDPVDGSVSAHQGIRVEFAEGGQAVYRLSGTGTEGATLRVYLERFEPDPGRHGVASDAALAPLAAAAASLVDLEVILGRSQPSVVA